MKPDSSKLLASGGGTLPSGLFEDVRALIESARGHVARAVDAGLVLRNWSIGARIRRDVLRLKRADYGEKILRTLSAKLVHEYGPGFNQTDLFNMMRFASRFPDRSVVSTLATQLGWSHFVKLIRMDDPLKRDFYAELCRLEGWSVRVLRRKIDGLLYERTALSRKPAKLAALELKRLRDEDRVTPDLVFQDPYVLDFLGLILCAGKSHEEIELLQLEDSVIRVAEYLIELPPRRELERKLHEAIRAARLRADSRA